MKYSLRMTQAQHRILAAHLFPGDGNEAVALILCGRANGRTQHVFTVREIRPIPLQQCVRRPDRITWPTTFVDDALQHAYGKGMAIVKVHSHPNDYRQFSRVDDVSDEQLFASVTSLLDDGRPHASLIMMPDGFCFGRVLGGEGKVLAPLSSVMMVGDDLHIWREAAAAQLGAFTQRHAQAFGKGTTQILAGLTVAIIGCSGTGSIVAEQLARLGVGKLILIDPDVIEEKNLNRILNSGKKDAYLSEPKVRVLARAIARMGLGQEVLPLVCDLMSKEAVAAVAEADVAFGCMDGAEGRHLLNRIATFYNLPYFDVGVRLDADGEGGIERIAGGVHYLQPGLSSLLSRGVYSMRRVEAEGIRRTDPEMYRRLVGEGYLRGVQEDRPAVISINMLLASMVVNEFLARIHPHRNLPNANFAYVGVNLSEMEFFPEPEGAVCDLLQKHVGTGDTVPLLDRPSLS
jgi:hypothetical protein